MPRGGSVMYKHQVLNSGQDWSDRDRAMIAAAIDELDSPEFNRTNSYIGVWANGVRVLAIYPTYLLWPGGRVASTPLSPNVFPRMMHDQDGDFHVFSNFVDR